MQRVRAQFSSFSAKIAYLMGTPEAFAINVLVILGWLVLGPHFHWSDSWQLPINSATTVTTWLLAILILNDGSRSNKATNIKLDAIIKSIGSIPDHAAGIESLDEESLERAKQRIEREIERKHTRS